MWVVALDAEFDHYLDGRVPVPSVIPMQNQITNSLPQPFARNTVHFTATRPGTQSASPGVQTESVWSSFLWTVLTNNYHLTAL